MSKNDALLRKEDVLKIIPISSATWYRLISDNPALKPIKIGRGSFWKKSVILDYIDGLES